MATVSHGDSQMVTFKGIGMYQVRKLLRPLVVGLALVLLVTGCGSYLSDVEGISPWNVVPLPTDSTMQDIAFTGDRQHGWLVGSNASILETRDGGQTWTPKPLDLLGTQNYRLTSVSFSGSEGWIVGEPAILLHTTNEGESWTPIPLSEKLPGSPLTITALGPNAAEMTTNVGAIYRTENGGQNWRAMVQEAIGVIRNIARSPDGKYIAVSSRGNFFSTWEPGQESWTQHNRTSSRRLQNMGFGKSGEQLWLLARGGQVQFGAFAAPEEGWQEPTFPEFATSWGLLDLAFRTPDELWVAGGSGNLLRSPDGGTTWQKDRAIENVPSNLYRIVFITPEQGFVLGQGSTLLRYQAEQPSGAPA